MITENAKIGVDGSTILAYREFDLAEALDPEIAQERGKPWWLPVNRVVEDNSTTTNIVTTHYPPVVQATQVYIRTVIRDKTQQEINDEIDNEAVNDLNRKTGKALYWMVNKIRVLEGQPEFTKEQFKELWKNL